MIKQHTLYTFFRFFESQDLKKISQRCAARRKDESTTGGKGRLKVEVSKSQIFIIIEKKTGCCCCCSMTQHNIAITHTHLKFFRFFESQKIFQRCAAAVRRGEKKGGKGRAVAEVSKCQIFVVVTWYNLRPTRNESWEIWRRRSSDFKVRCDDVFYDFSKNVSKSLSLFISLISCFDLCVKRCVLTCTCMDSDISTSGDLVLLERVESSVDVFPRRCQRVFFFVQRVFFFVLFRSYHVDSHKHGVHSGVC